MIKGILNFIQVNVGFGFDVESKQALQYFRDKGLRTSFSYADVTAQEHQAAFTVAKMIDMDLLKDVQDSLYAALAEGLTFDQWKDRIIPTLQANGWWGRQAVVDPITGKTVIAELGSARRLQTIFRTNMQSAYAVGQWQKIQEQAKEAPYLMYDAVDDFRTRPQHRAWDNKILPITATFWTRYYPPNGWGCRCGVIQLSQDDIDSMGMSVSDDPDIKWVNWKNPRTGKTERIPEGIDAGFQINAGMEREKYLKKLAKEKAEAIADDLMRDAAKVGLAKSVNVQKMTTPDQPSQPYAGLPPDNTDRLMDIVDGSVDVCDDMSVLPSFSAKNLESFVDSIRSYNKRFDQGKLYYIGYLNKKRWVVEDGSGALVGYSPDIDSLFVSREFLDDLAITDRIETWKVSGAGAEYQWANVAKQNTIAPDLKKVILSLGGVQKYEFNPTLAGIAAHEFGHRIHHLFNSEIDAIVNEGFRLGWASAISQYATTNPVEMMAETMVVYLTGTSDDLRRIYPPLLDFLKSIDKEIKR